MNNKLFYHYISFRSRQPKLFQSGTFADLPPLTLGPERDVITHVLSSLLQYDLHCFINTILFKSLGSVMFFVCLCFKLILS